MSLRIRRLGAQALVVTASWALIVLPSSARAGDLNAEVNTMFNNLGTLGNYTAPGAFRGQTMNTYTGGSLFLRAPNRTYQLASVAWPSARAGCGGIDVFGGSFSHISATEFKNMLKNITVALPGIAFQLALEAVSPLLGGLTKWAKGLETWINNARINSCETAMGLVSSAAEAVNYSSESACNYLARATGMAPDTDAARQLCATGRTGILQTAKASSDPDVRAKVPFDGNFTWKSLQAVPTLTDDEREFVMNVLGTVVFHPSWDNKTPDKYGPKITNLKDLLYGTADGSPGKVKLVLWKCNNFTDCDQPTESDYEYTPFTTLVENLMRSISSSIQTRSALPNNSPEVGFVNRTTLPVWRMLSVGNTIPGSGLADTMIMNYREIVAIDYASAFLEAYLRQGRNAVEKSWTLDKEQREYIKPIEQRASQMLAALANESSTLYQKKTAIVAVQQELQSLERELRTAMPQQVLDMLGHSAQVMR